MRSLNKKWDAPQGKFATILTDLDKSSLLEVIDSHKSDDIIAALKQQPLDIREGVEEVCVDMWGGFPKVIREVFPNAKIVVDRFHVQKWLSWVYGGNVAIAEFSPSLNFNIW